MSNVNDGMRDVKEIAAKINRGEGTMGKLVNDDSLYTEFRDASHNVKEITRKISEGEGTLGKLVNEDKMYRDATATLKKTEKAMEGLGDSGPYRYWEASSALFSSRLLKNSHLAAVLESRRVRRSAAYASVGLSAVTI